MSSTRSSRSRRQAKAFTKTSPSRTSSSRKRRSLNKIRLPGVVWIASDIQLGPHTPKTRQAFFRFLEAASCEADALILCGDIFDAWIGDDLALRDPPGWLDETLIQLQNTARHMPLWLGRGNRDFLLGTGLSNYLGAHLLPEISCLQTDHGEILLSHGDRKSVVKGKRVSVRVDLGGRRIIKKKT